MKIENSNVQLQASSYYREEYLKQETLRVWKTPQEQMNGPTDTLSISQEGLDAQKTEDVKKLDDWISDSDKMKLRLLELLLSKITGKQFRFRYLAVELPENATTSQPPTQPARVGWGMQYNYQESYSESEQMTFQGQGKVTLQDGRQIDFSLALHMSRSYATSTSFEMKAGDALKDPLVLNLDGRGVQFTGKTMHFDLDFNGAMDHIPVLQKGSGYLVLDRNNNQIMDDGSELFGPATDHGFSELAVHDGDKNGWIDENDSVFESLKVWVSDGQGGGSLVGLAQAGVGAIYIAGVNSQFTMKDAANNTQAKIQQSGIYLKENGQVAAIHEVDLKI